MKSPTDVVSGLLLLVFCAIGFSSVAELPAGGTLENIGPAGVPKAVLILLSFLSAVLIVKGFVRAPARPYWPDRRVLKKVGAFVGLFFLYLAGVIGLGDVFAHMESPPFAWGGAFGVSTFFFLCLALPLLGRRKPLEVFLVASLTTVCLLVAFGWFFQVMLP
ncbi:MAG: tripartite tricarboxylate transporter TctB family protein [Desulfovibrio sp.]|uniref:tripartite tricarboxylate transporter TctB family protein n=1 Tax=Desulfovibrio sp. TaxID=885 RepID=UPI0019C62252|nr:tripartite tricarboxylate transporter TctB family protein [Desulfovibrio sp.]MBD5416191.1 tripartite tricarboxylate transporter TctB family protein [Desulfovibrio sp.]MBD5627628.1 tripartite tricarboxylate transporter TctB family protein [Desulfovibrio sp.]MDE6735517.1 tripartite tricarboxylate transporter TctB family protein [Desulfovibrio sp.]MDE7370648.1 tripartite tricarboxylate transporter TctB family protein [Desulfovibrio sp.]